MSSGIHIKKLRSAFLQLSGIMKKNHILALLTFAAVLFSISFRNETDNDEYLSAFNSKLDMFTNRQQELISVIEKSDVNSKSDIENIRKQLVQLRENLKGMDIWLRYFKPEVYKKINGPLPVEFETEIIEKYDKPFRIKGAGLTLAELYLEEEQIEKDTLLYLIQASINALQSYRSDAVTDQLKAYHHFFLCNRLYLLNLAAIYTTGFECPDTSRIIPELRMMIADVEKTYRAFNESFPSKQFTQEYLNLYEGAIQFVNSQPTEFSLFDHFTFIKDYINPLYKINQQLINQYNVVSMSYTDYVLNNYNYSIFNKELYKGQDTKGIFSNVTDRNALMQIRKTGKLLFYDPILSGNKKRSCVSCHKSDEYFTDTAAAASFQFNHSDFLSRNTPSLVNVIYNQLLMADGKHISLQGQAKDVITNPIELAGDNNEILENILSCNTYRNDFTEYLKLTPSSKEITMEHIVSAIILYYSKFSNYYSPFDEAMNENKNIDPSVKQGFNLFMSRAQCGTCHFVPQFNGTKPPYSESEFEVLGVPGDTAFKKLSEDKGRFEINPANETLNGFRTNTLRNAEHTGPYMHNGVFTTLNQVIDFYNAGGGKGRGLKVDNQTLLSDSLHLSEADKNNLILFIKSLNEDIKFEKPPDELPRSENEKLNKRKVGGEY